MPNSASRFRGASGLEGIVTEAATEGLSPVELRATSEISNSEPAAMLDNECANFDELNDADPRVTAAVRGARMLHESW